MADKMRKASQVLMDEVLAIKAGTVKAKTWTPEQLLVISTRKALGKTQVQFATLLGVPLGTIRDWEQGRRKPDSAAITLVKVAEKYPDVLAEVA